MSMKNGFIFEFFDWLIKSLFYCNLVELFKFVATLIAKWRKGRAPGTTIIKANHNIAIDIYQLFKWAVVLVLWISGSNNLISLVIVAYLIAANLYTYFYYQVWGSAYVQKSNREIDNRRFLSTLTAIAYFIVAYAYLFQCHFSSIINWKDGINAIDSLYLSLANAFTLPTDGFGPATQKARMIFVTEVINTFLFFIIVLTNAIPNHINKEN